VLYFLIKIKELSEQDTYIYIMSSKLKRVWNRMMKIAFPLGRQPRKYLSFDLNATVVTIDTKVEPIQVEELAPSPPPVPDISQIIA
jgi:hypothetical protein